MVATNEHNSTHLDTTTLTNLLNSESLPIELFDRATIARMMLTALTTLEEIAKTSPNPTERRRAATTLLRALTARRPAPRAQRPHRAPAPACSDEGAGRVRTTTVLASIPTATLAPAKYPPRFTTTTPTPTPAQHTPSSTLTPPNPTPPSPPHLRTSSPAPTPPPSEPSAFNSPCANPDPLTPTTIAPRRRVEDDPHPRGR